MLSFKIIMGKTENLPLKRFTHNDIHNKDLVIKMLKHEEQLIKSNSGQEMYSNPLNKPLVSLNVEKSFNRMVLNDFNFDTSDESVENYRSIFRHYYKSPTDYDKDVLDSVHYMRENKCVYYQKPVLKVGDTIPDCPIYNLDGKTKTNLYDVIKKTEASRIVVAAFSLS